MDSKYVARLPGPTKWRRDIVLSHTDRQLNTEQNKNTQSN